MVFARLKDNIWTVELAEMGSLFSKTEVLNVDFV